VFSYRWLALDRR